MKHITVSAPGKLMLMGEHAVVYNRPCIVTAVGQRMFATIEILTDSVFELDAQDVKITGYKKSISDLGQDEIPKGARFVEYAVKNFRDIYQFEGGVRITTRSEFSSLFGFGSSSASTVCVIKGLSELFQKSLTNRQLFDIAYKTVLDIQGKGSGFDIAAAIYGGTLYFFTGGKIIEPLTVKELPLAIGYSGVKADTVTLMKSVSEKASRYPGLIDSIYTQIGMMVDGAKVALQAQTWNVLGELMDFNQGMLESLGVSSLKLARMIHSAKEAEAYGAKLSGAGGGDCMIALVNDAHRQNVSDAIEKAGCEVISIPLQAHGVRIETNNL